MQNHMHQFSNSPCDSSANVNVMSAYIVKKLGLRDLMLSNMALMFGDSFTKIPKGIVWDLQLRVGISIVPSYWVDVIDFLNHKISFKIISKYIFYAPVSLYSLYAQTSSSDKKIVLDSGNKIKYIRILEEETRSCFITRAVGDRQRTICSKNMLMEVKP